MNLYKMFKLTVVFSTFLLASCLGAVPRIRRPLMDGRIIGGSNANISEIPYQVSLEFLGGHICGGTIFAENAVLTAAYCVYGIPLSMIQIRAGTSTRENGGSVHPAADVVLHPNFDFFTGENNIALVMVSVPFEFSENVSPIDIATSEPAAGTKAVVSGWGVTISEGIVLPTQLQKVTVSIVDHDECSRAYDDMGGISMGMLCAAEKEGGKDSCVGDNGGPLVAGGQLVGVVSWSLCGQPGYPGVYTNIQTVFQTFGNLIQRNDLRLNKM